MFVAPFQINLLVTGQCNLSCRHCGVFSRGPLPGELTTREWEGILDSLVRMKVPRLTITGGEPLCREDFPVLLGMALQRPFRISVNTNAVLVDRGTAELFASAAPRLEVVMVSLDGDSPRTHDLIRGRGVFDGVMAGVDELNRAGVPVCFYFTVCAINSHRIADTAVLALEKGEYIKFNCFMDAGPETDPLLNPSPDQIREAAGAILDLAERHPGRVSGSFLEMAVAAERITAGSGVPVNDGPSCGGGISRISVMPDGSVTPCDHLPGSVLGDLTRSSLEDILTGERASEFFNAVRTRNRPWPECLCCSVRDFCPGPCPAGGHDRTGPGLTCIRNYMDAR